MNNDPFWRQAGRERHLAFGRDSALPDRAVRRERAAQALFFPALGEFERKVRDAAMLSSLMEEDFRTLLDALCDHAPTREYWDEKIADER